MIEAAEARGSIPWVASSLRRAARVELGVEAVRALVGSSQAHPVKFNEVIRVSPASRKFMSMVLTSLGHAGIIHSSRGHHGGYWLDRPLAQISLLDIVDALAPPIPGAGVDASGPSGSLHDALAIVWAELDGEAQERLRAIPIDRLAPAAVVTTS